MLNFFSLQCDLTSFSRIGFLGSFLLYGLSWVYPVQAQVSIDGTTLSSISGTCSSFCTIDGMPTGQNLLHSFSDFSLPTGTVTFSNPTSVNNLLIRVTGETSSYINGTINFPNFQNIFFLNPNGITFGSSSLLNFQGSFTASTRTEVNLTDGTTFLATGTPLLTMSVAPGLQDGSNAAPI
ncbi:MAG: filamentous hemagglutinin N-terminal domain-containing protein, partial [Cyanobacteria bacterium P01_E01_bin.42]